MALLTPISRLELLISTGRSPLLGRLQDVLVALVLVIIPAVGIAVGRLPLMVLAVSPTIGISVLIPLALVIIPAVGIAVGSPPPRLPLMVLLFRP